jgi:polyphosphate kinase
MRRNLDRRVEVLAPVRDPELKLQLDEVVDVLLADDALAWELESDGNWRKVSDSGTIDSQERLADIAIRRARRIAAL